MGALELRKRLRAHGGELSFYQHASEACDGPMNFAVFLPPGDAPEGGFPAVYFLSGLTCTEENFLTKAGALRVAARLGLALVVPDTSPRTAGVPGEDESYDLGTGAGFYLDATVHPWAKAYNMGTYVTEELPALVEGELGLSAERRSVFGHSMGGHGALVCALRHPGRYRSVSAFAPIVAPCQVPWGEKAFSAYLGLDRNSWKAYDACELVKQETFPGTILIDQGTDDEFLEGQLQPQLFVAACAEAGQALELRMQEGYDHSYYTISTFVEDHLEHHAEALRGEASA